MIIAVDGMGGDFSPQAIIEGCILAIKEYDNIDIIITGPEQLIKDELKKYDYSHERIKVLNATEVITADEQPVSAIRRKKDSSLSRALSLVKKGEADAIISAGSTGAFMAGSLFIVGRIKGINRPALAPIVPGKNNKFMIIDCGANSECKPVNIIQFAFMGKIYFENVLNKKNPSIGLINIGKEEEKGTELTKDSYKLLKSSDLNFIGNVEPRDITNGDTDILVCDGFTGNTVLKMYEGVSLNIFKMLKEEIKKSFLAKIGGLFLKPTFGRFKKRFDYKEYGGAIFLGVKGICIKAHGSSDGRAIKNAINQAIIAYDNKVIEKINSEIIKLND